MEKGLPARRVVIKQPCWGNLPFTLSVLLMAGMGRLAWSPAGFLDICGQLLHRAHKHTLRVLGLAEHVLHIFI